MNLVLLLSIILVTQLPLYTFGKSSSTKVIASTEVIPSNAIDHHETPSNGAENGDDGTRTRRNSFFNDDDDDFLINKLSREYVTSNLLDSTATACNK